VRHGVVNITLTVDLRYQWLNFGRLVSVKRNIDPVYTQTFRNEYTLPFCYYAPMSEGKTREHVK